MENIIKKIDIYKNHCWLKDLKLSIDVQLKQHLYENESFDAVCTFLTTFYVPSVYINRIGKIMHSK